MRRSNFSRRLRHVQLTCPYESLECRRLLAVTAPISLGQVKSGSLSSAQVDRYTFSGSAGQIIHIGVAQTNDVGTGFLPGVELLSPTGATILSVGFGGAVQGIKTLPASGTYVMRVHDNDFT